MASFSSKLAYRFAFNSAFAKVEEGNKAIFKLTKMELDPDAVGKDEKFPENFGVELHMDVLCRYPEPSDPKFDKFRKFYEDERPCWDSVYGILKDYQTPSKKESTILLFKELDRDNVEWVLSQPQEKDKKKSKGDVAH
mmetsp:Transcript_2597/g.2226  ORF Transcript_2597/g.2226 Transcript_2597/m.2226 type:complete len:138 (+) Transcript_2597:909-1322(+)